MRLLTVLKTRAQSVERFLLSFIPVFWASRILISDALEGGLINTEVLMIVACKVLSYSFCPFFCIQFV